MILVTDRTAREYTLVCQAHSFIKVKILNNNGGCKYFCYNPVIINTAFRRAQCLFLKCYFQSISYV